MEKRLQEFPNDNFVYTILFVQCTLYHQVHIILLDVHCTSFLNNVSTLPVFILLKKESMKFSEKCPKDKFHFKSKEKKYIQLDFVQIFSFLIGILKKIVPEYLSIVIYISYIGTRMKVFHVFSCV